MPKIEFRDFVPPIFHRSVRYVRRKFSPVIRMHPFDAIPKGVDARWVLDVGANRGDVAIAALKSYPNAQVICFEPVQKTFKELSDRLIPFLSRVHLFNYALSDREGEGEINITTFHGANSISPQAKFHQIFNPHVRELGKEKIRVVRLNDISTNFPSRQIDIMKIDVEGHELNVIKGGYEFISQNVDIIIIEISLMRDNSWEEQVIFEIFSFLNEAGFRLINITDVYPAAGENLLLAQMDCVFRHKSKLRDV